MRIPRISIAGAMVITAVLGLDLAAVRALAAWDDHPATYACFVSLPMASLLALVAARRIGPRGRRPGSGPFLAGFLAFGSVAMVATAGLYVARPEIPEAYRRILLSPLDPVLGKVEMTDLGPTWGVIVQSVFKLVPIFVPQVLVGALGGRLAARYWATGTRRRPPVINAKNSA